MRKYTPGEGISPVKEFDVTDIDAEKEEEEFRKTDEAIKALEDADEKAKKAKEAAAVAKVQENLQKKQELARARENLANISDKEIEGGLANLEEVEELSEEDIEFTGE